MMRPGATGYSPLRMWTSVPQIVVIVTRTMASVGPQVGTGRSCSVITPGRSNTAARIESVPARVRAGPETGDAVMAHLARCCWFLDATGGAGEPHRQFAANRFGGLRNRQPRADAGRGRTRALAQCGGRNRS